MSKVPPQLAPDLSARARRIVDVAQVMLEDLGWVGVTMRPLAERLGVRATSIYKHFDTRDQIKSELVARGLVEVGEVLHTVVDAGGSVTDLLDAYRALGSRSPNLYRLTTAGPLDRAALPPGLEEWAGAPFHRVTGNETLAQALWSFAHGVLVLELDGRYPPGTRLEHLWHAGAARFAPPS